MAWSAGIMVQLRLSMVWMGRAIVVQTEGGLRSLEDWRVNGLQVSGQQRRRRLLFLLTGWMVRSNWLSGSSETAIAEEAAELLAALGSATAALTLAEAVREPQLTATAPRVTWAVAPLAREAI